MDVKLKMLECYESRWKWLKETQDMDNFLDNMRPSYAKLASKALRNGTQYAEDPRQYRHVDFSAEDKDPVSLAQLIRF